MPSFTTFIARKYFFSLGKLGAIRLMSLTALIGLALGTAAMTVVLSAFAGLEGLIADQFRHANPDLKISSATGPHLQLTSEDTLYFEQLKLQYPEATIAPIYKKRVLLSFGENQHITYLLGVDSSYTRTHHLTSHLISQADPALDLGPQALTIGSGVAYHLGLSSTNPPPVVTIYLPRVTKETTVLNLTEAIEAENAFVNGIFSLQPDFDQQHVIAPAPWVQQFTSLKSPSYLEVHSTVKSDLKSLRASLEKHFSERVHIANTLEQEATLFKVMRSERIVVLAILSFVVLLASFGIVSALTIIALEKKNDIHTLHALGASDQTLRSIFFKNGMLIVLFGWAVGLVIGTTLILLQQHVGIIPLGSGYVQEYYPVTLTLKHIVMTTTIVLTIGTLLSAWATRNVARKIQPLGLAVT